MGGDHFCKLPKHIQICHMKRKIFFDQLNLNLELYLCEGLENGSIDYISVVDHT